MHKFTNDYSEGACPEVLDALVRTNAEQAPGYTCDEHCQHASELILEACGLSSDEADVYYVVGGTAANVISLCGLLDRPYDAVVCTPDGHINTHESGAIESCGHKALPTRDADGFLNVAAVDEVVRANRAFENHMTRPRVLYVSDTTELGGVYRLEQLHDLERYARDEDLRLFVDGARLGVALTAPTGDVTLTDIARLADAFYLGGTKNGLLFGEAVVVRDPQLRVDFPWLMKQHQNLLAKGRLLGVQFEAALSTSPLDGSIPYWRCARQANQMALRLGQGLTALGFEAARPIESNQIFLRVPNDEARGFVDELGCEVFFDEDTHKVVRLVTSWATTESDVDEALSFAGTLMA